MKTFSKKLSCRNCGKASDYVLTPAADKISCSLCRCLIETGQQFKPVPGDTATMQAEIEIKNRLAELGKALRGTKPDSRSHRIIMAEIDKLLDPESPETDHELEEQWERGRR